MLERAKVVGTEFTIQEAERCAAICVSLFEVNRTAVQWGLVIALIAAAELTLDGVGAPIGS